MKLLVGYDGSEFARRALERTATLAHGEATVLVATVIPGNAEASDMVGQQRLLQEAKAAIGGRAAHCELLELRGAAAQALMQAAREHGVDLLVVGTRGRGAAASLLLGSVSTSLAREAPCDVVIVR